MYSLSSDCMFWICVGDIYVGEICVGEICVGEICLGEICRGENSPEIISSKRSPQNNLPKKISPEKKFLVVPKKRFKKQSDYPKKHT